jgi:Protein of unknown function (DUF3341)
MPEQELESDAPLFGVSAEFASAEALVRATNILCSRGLGRVDAYSPLPIAELARVLGLRRPPLTFLALIGAVGGGGLFFWMLVYATAYDYPFNIGGRPPMSWPYFIIPSFSIATLTAGLVVTLLMLFLNRLPRLNHPVFNIEGFERASQDRFFVCVEARDDDFDAAVVERCMAELPDRPLSIQRVPR